MDKDLAATLVSPDNLLMAFTAIVTNVSGLPITYHWSAASGTLTDSASTLRP